MRRACSVLALLSGVLFCQCHCGRSPAGDADGDGDTATVDSGSDGDIDADIDADIDGDLNDAEPDLDEDPDLEVEQPAVCGEDDRPAWSWSPYECSDEPTPRDCCASCRQLTCRGPSLWAFDIWGDKVVYEYDASVGIVDVSTGEDTVIFSPSLLGEDHFISYLHPAISSRYILALKVEGYRVDGEARAREAVVARCLSTLSGTEIVLDDSEDQRHVMAIDAYDEWVVWGRHPSSTDSNETVLHNIETGDHRVIKRDRDGYYASLAAIWGDRVVWGANGNLLEEYRISTGETRTAFEAPLEMQRIQNVMIWDHYAIYNPQPSGRGSWDIILVDLDTGEARLLSPADTGQDQVSIQGGRVIWTDLRSAGPHLGMHIYIYSLRDNREYVLNPSARAGSEPLIFDRTVVWDGLTAEGVSGVWVTRIGDI